MADAIRVCVRCRPLNAREKARGAVPLIRIQGNTCHLDPDPKERSANAKAAEKETKSFSFDRAFDSQDKSSPDYASQQIVFDYLGRDLLNHAFEGFNCGIFAYGQTGSGKSYSMMGYGEERGIIPLTCEELFRRIEAETTDTVKYSVSVSFMEIYNEKVRDLLNPKNKGNLRVREHPSLGVYVEDLAKLVVRSYGEVEALMEEGNQARTVAATNMNETSSRSHSIFTLLLTQTRKDQATGLEGEKVSKISLIDLAGSERANSTGATGTRLKEGANINRSLTTLGKVIAALAASPGKGKKDEFVPFRDSVLTWLLKDSLGGNSKTAMIAALSSADYEETLSTLRYADSAKKIKTRAVVNEDPTAKLIRELKEELTSLRTQMGSAVGESTYDPTVPPEKQIVQYKSKTGEIKTVTKAELEEQLGQSEKLLADVNQTWEEKLEETQKIQVERERALEELGISIEKNQVGVHPPKRMPHLVNLNEDPLMSECLIYQIKPGKTTVGNLEATAATDIRLSGEGIRDEHCYFTNEEDGVVLLHALPDGVTMVNGRRLQPDKPRPLKSGYRIIIGEWHVFRFNHPLEVQKVRDRIKNAASEDATASLVKQEPMEESRESRPGSPAETMAEDADWNFARREVLRVNGIDIDLDTLPDQDLHILSKNLERVRGSRKSASISGRPESRMSYLFEEDEDDSTGSPASRPFSSNQTWSTADTSEGPGAASFGLPDLDDRLIEVRQEMEAQLADQRIEYEEKLRTMENGAMSSHDIEIERSVMQTQLATVQKEMKAQLELQREQYEKRLQRAQKRKRLVFADDEDEYTEQEKALLKNSITQWRTHTLVKVAEETLAHAVHLKEANVISQELGKDVSFQFAVGQRSLLGLNSAMSQLAVAEEASEPQTTDKTTGLLVRMTDLRNKTITLWSLARFMHHLEAMRKLYKFVDQPSYSRHLDYDEPFRSIDPPLYSAIGFASVSLAPINCNVSSSTLAPIICPFTLEAIGRCRIRLQPKSSVTPSAGSQSSDPATVSRQRVLDGTHLTYIILVDEFEGLSADQLSHVHCQVRKSAFLPADAQSPESITVSEELVLGQRSITKLQLYKEVTLRMDAGVRHHLSRNFLAVEVFGRPTAEFLSYIEAWDTTLVSKSRSASKGQAGRRPEAEMIAEQRHDVLAHIYVCELDANGSYLPVPVVSSSARDPGAFHLRHGLQRQVVVELKHSSGRAWPWLEIDEVTLGDVRLLDAKGLVHASPTRDPLILKALDKERAMYESDGTSRLSFTATWDSSAHGSTFLNRTTPPSSYVLVKVSWTVKGAGHEPIPFNCDIALSVQSRDAKPPSKFFSMFSTNRTLSDRCTLFSVSLKPPPAPLTADQLWRRDTSEVYVRGEEILKKWKPHSVGLVEAYRDAVERESKRAQSEATRSIVEAIPKTSLLSGSYGQDEESKLAKALEQWQSWHFLNTKVQLKQAPSKIVRKKSSKGKEKPRKRIGTASIIPSNDVVVKKSHLSILRDPSNSDWERAFYSLRRPYLYIYESSSESKLKAVINIDTVRVETNQELSVMTGRKFVWALYTPTNCYFMQADSANLMSQWMVALDPGYQQ